MNVILMSCIATALFCICVAGIKNRDLTAWFLVGAAVPIAGAIAICVLPRLDDEGRPIG